MHVDVDLLGGHLNEEDRRGADVARAVRIGLAQRVGDRRRGRGASVDEDVLVAARRLVQVRALDEAADPDRAGGAFRRQQVGDEVPAENVEDALGKGAGRREALEFASVHR